MKLSRILLDQFQQFRTPLEVADLGEGINRAYPVNSQTY
jgi:hypothetical protein